MIGVSKDHETGTYLKLAAEVRTLPADVRAGDWPSGVIDAMRKLAIQCVAAYRDRPADLGVVVKALETIQNKYC